MNSKLKNESTDFLFDAILSLDNKEECYRFFEDLCTSAELKAMSQRLVVAKMLTEKKVYTEIVKETGASTATISRVKRALFDNDTYGYTLVLDKLLGEENKEWQATFHLLGSTTDLWWTLTTKSAVITLWSFSDVITTKRE